MREKYFRKLLKQLPFEPLRVHVSTGSFYDIPHPDFARSDDEALIITDAQAKQGTIKEVHCSWLHVSHVEVLR